VSQRLDVIGGPVGRGGDDTSTHGDVAGRAGRIEHRDGDPRVALHVAQLLEAGHRIDQDVFAVGVDPGSWSY
jgi:hypothetical protein